MSDIQALRERGAERFDPVRWRFIEALARRTQAQQGAARPLLEARLQALLADYAQAFEQAAAQPVAASAPQAAARTAAAAPAPTPLHALSLHIAQHATPAGSELKTLDWFRRTWSRISVGRRMTHAMAKKPEKAGPINSHGLVLRALQQLGAVSPDYLDRYVAYADALLALDQATGGAAMLHRDVLRSAAETAAAAPRRTRARAASKPALDTTALPAVVSVRKRR